MKKNLQEVRFLSSFHRICHFSAFGTLIIAGRPKAVLLLWLFGDFRCGALLFVVIHVIYKYKNR